MIDVDHLHLNLRATATPQRAAVIERRVRDVMQAQLPRALDRMDLADEKSALIFIDRLEVTTSVSTAWDDDRIAAVFARSFAAQLVTAIESGVHGVRQFTDRAQWIAEFLIELADGAAWKRWWFDDMDGLRVLPTSAALRTAIVSEGDVGISALTRLANAGVARLMAAIDEVDLQRIVAAWTARDEPERVAVPRLWRAAESLIDARLGSLLRAAVEVEREQRGAINARTMTLLAAIVDLLPARAHFNERVVAFNDDPRALLQAYCAVSGITQAWLDALDADDVQALVDLLAAAPAGSDTPRSEADVLAPDRARVPRWHGRTEYGGAFILLAVMSWLRWIDTWRTMFTRYPDTEPVADELARSIALAVIAKVLVPGEPQRVVRDQGLLAAWSCADPTALVDAHHLRVRAALRAVGVVRAHRSRRSDAAASFACGSWIAAAAASLVKALAERIPGCADASAGYLRHNLLAVSAGISCSDGAMTASGRIDVRLSRAPLHVLLMIAGLARITVQLGACTVVIHTEDAG